LIRQGLEIVRREIQSFLDLKDSEGIREVAVVCSNILGQDGKEAYTSNNSDGKDHHLVLTLVNIEEEKNLKPPHKIKEIAGEILTKQNPELHINLYVLFTAFSSQYETSLGIISDIIGFFQGKPLFTHSNTPSLNPKIEKIIAELYTLTFEQQNYLWSVMGAKYIPSVLYKLRMLTIDEEIIKDKSKPVMEINITE
jgi:hypothetical protein